MAATRFGTAFVVMTLGFALVLALVYPRVAARPRRRSSCRRSCWRSSSSAGCRVSGHDAVDPGSSWLTELADWVHIAAASLWIGGLATMVGARLVRRARACARHAFLRFSQLATVLIALVLARGHVPQHRSAAAPARPVDGGLRAGAARQDRPRLRSRSRGARSTTSSSRPRSSVPTTGFLTRIGRSLAGESLVGVAVLLVAAVLVDSKPPVRAARIEPSTGGSSQRRHWAGESLPSRCAALVAAAARRRSTPASGLRARASRRQPLGGRARARRRRCAIDPASGKVTSRINVGARVFNLASAPGAVWAVSNLTVDRRRASTRAPGSVTATVQRRLRAVRRRVGVRLGVGRRTRATAPSRASPARRS